jgi:hypothetical protein
MAQKMSGKSTLKAGGSSGKQVANFKAAARELGCDESEKAFDKTLRKLGGNTKPKGRPSPK